MFTVIKRHCSSLDQFFRFLKDFVLISDEFGEALDFLFSVLWPHLLSSIYSTSTSTYFSTRQSPLLTYGWFCLGGLIHHKPFFRDINAKPRHFCYSPRIVCGFFNVPQGTYERFIVLIRKSNHLQIKLQRQHFLLSYFMILSIDPAGVRIRELPRDSPMLNQLSHPCAVIGPSLLRTTDGNFNSYNSNQSLHPFLACPDIHRLNLNSQQTLILVAINLM